MSIEETFNTNFGLADLQDVTVTSKAKPPKNAPDQSLIDFAVTIPDPTGLVVVLSLTRTQTAALSPGDYQYDIQVVNNTDGITRNTPTGKFTVQESIT